MARQYTAHEILNSVYRANLLPVRYLTVPEVLNMVYDETNEVLNVNINNLVDTFNTLYSRYVFRETLTGDGVSTSFYLSGAIGNATFAEGTWDAENIIIFNPVELTTTSFGALYDSTNIFTRHRITCTNITSTGRVDLDYAPRLGQEFYIWYWYSVTDGDEIHDYQREEFVASVEVGLDHTHTLSQITDFNEDDFLHPWSVDKSIEYDSGAKTISLVNDEDDPGENKVYGTNASGVKGWKDDPVITDPSVYTDDTLTGNGTELDPLIVDVSALDHELLDGLEGGDASHHYHSDQPINITDDVVFNKASLTSIGQSSEYIVTVNESTGELKTEIPTDSEWITNSTIISALLLETNWILETYTGTTTGAVDGQMYICCKYLYVFKNSTFVRFPISTNANITTASATIAASAALNTTDTVVSIGISIPKNTLVAGSTYELVLFGTCTSSNADTSTFTGRIGTTNSITDGALFTVTLTSAGAGTNIPFQLRIRFTVRTIGATGTIYGHIVLINEGTTGIYTATTKTGALSSVAAFNSTVENWLNISYITSAVTTTSTFQNVTIEKIR